MHNVLVNAALADWAPTHGKKYTGLPSFVSHTNERGPVYTGGYAPKGVYSQTKQGVFLNSDGDVYRVLHQYDRHVYMTEALAAVVSRLGAAGSHRRVPLQQPPAAAATTAAVAQVSTGTERACILHVRIPSPSARACTCPLLLRSGVDRWVCTGVHSSRGRGRERSTAARAGVRRAVRPGAAVLVRAQDA
jgi:hypothetical protein